MTGWEMMRWRQTYDEAGPRDGDFDDEALVPRIANAWHQPKGFIGWLKSTDHKSIGIRYIVTAFCHLLFAGLLAMIIRLQLAFPEMHVLDPDLYNQVFTMHGTVMMFLFAVPMVEGMMIYLVPLMVGSRIIAFPRLNAFSYWMYLAGGLMVWIAFFVNSGPDAGWFSYVPLAGPEFGAGKRSDIWAQMITFTEVAGLAVAVEIVVTIMKLRAPGMTLNRMPIFVWASLVTSIMIILSMPSIVTTSTFLILDRLIGTHFFNPAEGGDPLLWQHLFWYFAHPEVYIVFLPPVGLASHVIETFCRRRMFGYPAVVLAIIGQGFLSFGLWVHHMYAAGLPRLGNSFFEASSMSIAIPSGTIVFCWLATLASGRIRLGVPMLWVISFFLLFLLGGFSGVMISSVPFDLQATDTYVIVSHLHFVLIGGTVALLLAAGYFWFPKFSGRLLDDRLGTVQWAMFTLGSLVAFSAMFVLGLSGMTRRVWTYPHGLGWDAANLIASLGAWTIGLSFLLMIVNIWKSLAGPKTAPDNPWDASTLEWSVASPPPDWNFLRIPVIDSRTPIWDNRDGLPAVGGLRTDVRQVLVTSAITTTPQMRDHAPDPSLWPLITAVVSTIVLIASIYTPWAIVWGAIPVFIVLVGWLYPRKMLAPRPGEVSPEAMEAAKP